MIHTFPHTEEHTGLGTPAVIFITLNAPTGGCYPVGASRLVATFRFVLPEMGYS